MNVEDMKKILLEYQEILKSIETKPRQKKLNLDINKVTTVVGPRRAGKTYFTIHEIKNQKNILYLNFEDERLEQLKISEYDQIIQAFLELNGAVKDFVVFFDEIQFLEKWEKFIRRIYDQYTKKIIITGSNSKLTSKGLSYSMRGRNYPVTILPLSFKEYLEFRDIKVENIYTTTNIAQIRNALKMYLTSSGFPELIGKTEVETKTIIQTYLNTTILKDLIEFYHLSNEYVLKKFITKIIFSCSNQLSIHKIHREFKSENIKINKNTLYEYFEFLKDIFFVFSISNLENRKSQKKIYLCDHGYLNSLSLTPQNGKILENTVFLELKLRNHEIYYHQDRKECDFILKKGNDIIQAIQVTEELNESNRKREVDGLIEAMSKYGLKQGLILTSEQEDELVIEGHTIKLMPLWKWLLSA